MAYRTVGNTLVQWDDAAPFRFELSEKAGPADIRSLATLTVDLSELRSGFTDDFVLNLKERLIEWRNRVALRTIEKYSGCLIRLFKRVIALDLFDAKIALMDEAFMLVLDSAKEQLPAGDLDFLRTAFRAAPHSPLWASDLYESLIPRGDDKKGFHGMQIARILSKALTRSTCVYILSQCEQAYEAGKMDIGHFAFVNLAFSVFCRPESYRQIRLNDLVYDEVSKEYFLYIVPVKSGVLHPEKLSYRIAEPVGILLTKQRQNVVNKHGHLVDPDEIGKLALFPARQLAADKASWIHPHANMNFGAYENSTAFALGYPKRIQMTFLKNGGTLNANALRHTLGTTLAHSGASARAIQAALKHATDSVCKAYVDIVFNGLIDALSDALRPAFENHLPMFDQFRSINDPVAAEQAIRSEDRDTGKIELTGECGKKLQCEYAPISCYGCPRFIPCWDADHGVNLAIVQREIDDGKRRGTPFQHSVSRWTQAKFHIVLVMSAADRYRQARTDSGSGKA